MHLHFKSHPNLLSSKSTRSSSLRKRASLLLGRSRFRMESFFSAKLALLSKLRSVRYVSIFLGVSNLAVIILGAFLMVFISLGCSGSELLPFAFVSAVAAVRIASMIGTGMAQEATATTILSQPHADTPAVEAIVRHERRMRYKRWLWWTRLGMLVTMLQFVGATYLMFALIKDISYGTESSSCILGNDTYSKWWKTVLVVFFLILVLLLVMIQCFSGSDVLRWRSFYETQDHAWKAHYSEVFDYGLREVLCCMGRVKYLSVLEEDEVYSVARLLGDLVAYRASGTGHLELLAGLALLQRQRQSTNSSEDLTEAPESLIQEALTFHPFAEAAYTGPLLDFGRNPVLFPCAWLYRQGILTPWSRNRRPVLEGDNWWRGHAAAFLKCVNISSEALRRGRVSQKRREAAYFVVVLHHLKSVVIAVRGTETPEDLITDGLCKECAFSMEDLQGLINGENVDYGVKQHVLSSFPHYGHSGIVESARELFVVIDGQPQDKDAFSSGSSGFLSSLMGTGSECDGYKLRIVGHSLGGAVAALLGLMLYHRFPNLHVYTYGTLPCVDMVLAEACSDFVTSIVYNDEFSSRLSVTSILRLRAAAISTLSQDSAADSAVVRRLALRFFNSSKLQHSRESGASAPSVQTAPAVNDNNHYHRRQHKYASKGVFGSGRQLLEGDDRIFASDMLFRNCIEPDLRENFSHSDITNAPRDFDRFNDCDATQPYFESATDGNSCDPVSCIVEGFPLSIEEFNGGHMEMFLPGLVIHIVPERRRRIATLWKRWSHDRGYNYNAFVANRESFKEMIVSPYMFVDHLPWRCHTAMKRTLENRKMRSIVNDEVPKESHMV